MVRRSSAFTRTLNPVYYADERWARQRQAILRGFVGLSMIFLALLMLLSDPIDIFAKVYLRMSEGTLVYNMWETPPVAANIQVYIFNATNSDRFLSGEDTFLQLAEVGPFNYLEIRTNKNMTIDRENGVVRMIPHREVKFVPELSIGHPKDYIINIPNIPYLAISSLISEQSFFTQMALNLLAAQTNTNIMLNMTAYDFLWGYEDELVRTANTLLPGWIDFPKFGILDRMYNDVDETIEIEMNNKNRIYSINKWAGIGGLKQWGYTQNQNTKCNQVNGSYEGLFFSPKMNTEDNIYLYRKQICRTLKMEYTGEKYNDFGIKVRIYKPVKNVFEPNDENNCLCKNKKCLPKGLSDLSPCYYRLPVAMSWPHFMDGDASLFEKIRGMKPDRKRYETNVFIEPTYGLTLGLESSSQSSVVIGDLSYTRLGKRFTNMVLPFVWMKMEMEKIPPFYQSLIRWLFIYGPILMIIFEVFLAVGGVIIIIMQIYRYIKPFGSLANNMAYSIPNIIHRKSLVKTDSEKPFLDRMSE